MNRLNLTIIVLGLLTIAACKKGIKTEESSRPATTSKAAEECQPVVYNLAVDSVTGESYIFKVSGSPSAGPITVTPYVIGGGTNKLMIGGTTPILRASGLSYDPTSGTFYGTTGSSGSIPNAILKFTNPNFVSIIPAVNTCGPLVLDLSDVERDHTTGVFYAINRGTSGTNNRIVKLSLPASGNVSCLPNPLPPGLNARGLTFNCNGMLYVMHTSWANGTIVFVDKLTGLNGAAYAYPGPITSAPAVPVPDLGLHFDCACIGRFITASFNRITAPLVTDGLPAGLGGPVFSGVVGFLKPTVDFARP